MTSEPEYHFGNLFLQPDLTRMLGESPARQKFVERPGKLVLEADCIACRFLSICHGGCRVVASAQRIGHKVAYRTRENRARFS